MVVKRLDCGSVLLAGKYNPPSFEDSRISVFSYLIQTPNKTFLVDTGMGEDNTYVNRTFKPDLITIDRALGKHGLSIGDVDGIVNSHLHFDHCGNNRLFTNIPHYVQAAEAEVASSENYTVGDWFFPECFEIVEGDQVIAEGVTLLSTPGHTPGHQSVLVEDDQHKLLVAAQAAFSLDEYRRGGDPEVQAHTDYEGSYLESINRLKAIDADRIYLSHDVRECL